MTDQIPVAEWTDEEWLRVMKELDPDVYIGKAERAVARWRKEDRNGVC